MTRLNFTGRKRILRENLRLHLELADSVKLRLEGIDLSEFDLPEDAKVVVEPYRQTRRQRIDVGRVGDLRFPQTWDLADFDLSDNILFRVKVVGVGGAQDGKLLAAADSVPPISADASSGKQSLLPVRSADLGQRLWRLSFDDDSPVLEVSRDLSDWNQFARRPIFHGLVYPEVLSQIAMWLIENADDIEPDTPPGRWDRYFREVLRVNLLDCLPAEPSDELISERADEVASRFSQLYKLRFLVESTDEDGGDI